MFILHKSDVTLIDSIDNVGQIFLWKNRIFRAINCSKVIEIKRLLSSGLVDELVRNNFFPKTTVTEDISLYGFDLVLEHERIPYVSVPSEWSFNMLKDVCLAYLEINKICGIYGYTLKDGHLFNLTFLNNHPIYFDLGSIVYANSGDGLFEFYNCAVIPLQIWGKGDFYLANLILRDDYSHNRFLPSICLADHKVLQPIVPFYEKNIFKFIRRIINYCSRKLFKRKMVSLSELSYEKLTKKICKTKKITAKTTWSNYQDEYVNSVDVNLIPRFDRIIYMLNTLNLSSMIDLAGNKGVFSLLVSKNTSIKQIYCIDYDEPSVDSLYIFVKNNGINKISPILLNFVCPIFESIDKGLKADISVALAVTHHLLLTQSFSVDKVLRRIGVFSHRYVLVEFMPLGLWDGEKAPPIPEWYRVEWFREKFKEQFNLLVEEQTEPNRIFFLGEKRSKKKMINFMI